MAGSCLACLLEEIAQCASIYSEWDTLLCQRRFGDMRDMRQTATKEKQTAAHFRVLMETFPHKYIL